MRKAHTAQPDLDSQQTQCPDRGRIDWRSLASSRVRTLSDVHYRFHLHIDRAASWLRAQQTIEVTLTAAPRSALLLDWQPEDEPRARAAITRTLRVNGHRAFEAGARLTGSHLEIPPLLLRRGHNYLQLAWQARIRDADSALVRFRDPADDRRYVYTLFVPADASSIFPCFDQPNLKARFTLTLRVPRDWQAIANAPMVASEADGGSRILRFAPTEPLSTYLFSFAAGPFRALRASDPAIATRLWVRRSQLAPARAQRDAILELNEQAMRYFARYLAHRFPFPKYDLVLLPEFPFRGMEHAAATFLNEQATLLRANCGDEATLQRALLIYHETAHQWLGNLVTMRSFDDLWIKEGFANFMAYKLAARTALRAHADVAFNVLKASAIEIDQGPGTRALHWPLPDARAAKAAYGPIVYGKAPAVLRQLESQLGAGRFRQGVRRFVHRHAYGSADWRDFVDAMEGEARGSLARWSLDWIARPGVPTIGITPRDGGARLELRTFSARIWPLRLEIGIEGRGKTSRRRAIALDAAPQLVALPRSSTNRIPVRIDPDDTAYAVFRIETRALHAMALDLRAARRPLHRMQVWQALWQSVRAEKLAPARFLTHVLEALPVEDNEIVLRAVLAKAHVVSTRFLARPPLALIDGLEAMVRTGLMEARSPARARLWVDALLLLARSPSACDLLVEIACGQRRLPHLVLEPEDRVRAAASARAQGRAIEPRRLLAGLPNGSARRKAALLLAAAAPERESKRSLLDRYLSDGKLPEAWIVASLPYFNHCAHAHLTLPLLPRALDALPPLARIKKVFFINRWLESFLGGQHSAEALAQARAALKTAHLAPDIALKVIEAIAELRSAVAIRRRWQRER